MPELEREFAKKLISYLRKHDRIRDVVILSSTLNYSYNFILPAVCRAVFDLGFRFSRKSKGRVVLETGPKLGVSVWGVATKPAYELSRFDSLAVFIENFTSFPNPNSWRQKQLKTI